jgi:tetratricopeptide repeat protein
MVQTIVKVRMDQDTYHHWIQRVIQLINRAFPAVEAFTTWLQCQRLLPHALVCITLIEERQIISEDAGRLLHQTGAYLLECAYYPQAEVYITRAQTIRRQLLGPEHPDVAESLNYIAELAYYKGEYRQAEQFHLQALHIRQQQLGSLHPDVATSFNNLAAVYRYLPVTVLASGKENWRRQPSRAVEPVLVMALSMPICAILDDLTVSVYRGMSHEACAGLHCARQIAATFLVGTEPPVITNPVEHVKDRHEIDTSLTEQLK